MTGLPTVKVLLEGGPCKGETHVVDMDSEWIRVEFADVTPTKDSKLDYAWYRWTRITLPDGTRLYRYDPRAL